MAVPRLPQTRLRTMRKSHVAGRDSTRVTTPVHDRRRCSRLVDLTAICALGQGAPGLKLPQREARTRFATTSRAGARSRGDGRSGHGRGPAQGPGRPGKHRQLHPLRSSPGRTSVPRKSPHARAPTPAVTAVTGGRKYTDAFSASARRGCAKVQRPTTSASFSSPIDFVGLNVYTPHHYVDRDRQRSGLRPGIVSDVVPEHGARPGTTLDCPRRCIGRRVTWRNSGA